MIAFLCWIGFAITFTWYVKLNGRNQWYYLLFRIGVLCPLTCLLFLFGGSLTLDFIQASCHCLDGPK